ncbi:hypothetical protein, partial [Staphylococcus aureus]|uniref:hypothetical protein n=1 Tax=Staphylococcus aureus TaxID=1280 RepID=UPI0020BF36FE
TAQEEGDHYLETDKRATHSLDSQIEAYQKYCDRNTEDIERAYSSIQANLIMIRKKEIETESMKRFIALLETFREDLQNGVDVSDEYPDLDMTLDPQQSLNLTPNEGTVTNALKKVEEVKTNPQRKTTGRRTAKPKGEE